MNGAQATVYIEYSGTLEELAVLIEKEFSIPAFYLKSDIDYPHSICAMSECLGFEIWLQESNKYLPHNFCFQIESYMNVAEKFKVKSYDLSDCFVKRIFERTGLKSRI